MNSARMKDFDFTAPVVELECGYLIPQGSLVSTSADVDRPAIRVGVQERSTADSILSRTLRNAMLIRSPSRTAAPSTADSNTLTTT
jgi:polar amino acid transport system substrate-binding protein